MLLMLGSMFNIGRNVKFYWMIGKMIKKCSIVEKKN